MFFVAVADLVMNYVGTLRIRIIWQRFEKGGEHRAGVSKRE
jgi:hypothetical protein